MGPARSGRSHVGEYNTLQVDGIIPHNRSVGALQDVTPSARGARITVGGGQAYTDIGLDGYERQAVIDFSPHGNRAMFTTLDRASDPDQHVLTWNYNPAGGGLDGMVASLETVGGRPAFRVQATGGAVIGVLLHPSTSSFSIGEGGEPISASFPSDETLWIAMLCDDDGAQSAPSISGSGLASELTWDGRVLRYDATTQQQVVDLLSTQNTAPEITAPGILGLENPITGSTVAVDVGATDNDGDDLTYTWSTISGPESPAFSVNNSTSSATVATFSTAGTYVFAVTVSDGKGGTATAEATCEVIQVPSDIQLSTD